MNTVMMTIACNMRRRRGSVIPRRTSPGTGADRLTGQSLVKRIRNSAANAQYAAMATSRI